MKRVLLFVMVVVTCLLLCSCGKTDIYELAKPQIKDSIHARIASMALLTYGSVTTTIDITSMEEDPDTTVKADRDFDELKAYKVEGKYTIKTINGQIVNSGYLNANYSAVRKGEDVAVIENSLNY